ncbi:MAG: hypothetical protein H0T12_05835, partial [Actinobacteria bacterium]|nr:hypothetical protein [Actinomycetota bacterium]
MADKLTRDAVERLADRLGEPGWLAERRLEAFDLFSKMDPPDPRGEEWRYTDVRRFNFDRFGAPKPSMAPPSLPDELAGKGVIFTDFKSAARDCPE